MNIQTKDFTLAIVTRKRPAYLSHLLRSLSKMSLIPGQILVVDNDVERSAFSVFQKWQSKLPIKYQVCTQIGTPASRNFALDLCETRFLCFVDDDCRVNRHWFDNLFVFSKVAFEYQQVAYIQGQSGLLNKNNIWARVQYRRYRRWFYRDLNKSKIDPLLLDTKNICFDLSKFNRSKVRFDKNYGLFATSGSEDTDFGLQLHHLQLRGVYCQYARLLHREASSFFSVIKKIFQKGRLSFLLQQKWQFCDIFQKDVYLADNGCKLASIFFKNWKDFFVDPLDKLCTLVFQSGVWYQKKLANNHNKAYC